MTKNTKDLISKCLMVDEKKRISFEQMFMHDLFKDCFGYQMQEDQVSHQNEKVLLKLCNGLKRKNLTVPQLMKMADKNNSNSLTILELKALMLKVDKTIDRYRVEKLFNSIDLDHDGNITVSELESVVKKFSKKKKYFNDEQEVSDEIQFSSEDLKVRIVRLR